LQTDVHQTEQILVSVLVQLIVIVLAARLAGSAAAALRQPRVIGEMIAGLALGPSLLGRLFPDFSSAVFSPAGALPITILSQIGLILLMFQIGSEFEFGQLRTERNRKAVLFTSIASLAAPLLVGFTLGWITAPVLAAHIEPLSYSLFVAVALAITAVPVLGRILREYGLNRSDVGVIAISAAAVNDVAGWICLAAISAFAGAQFSLANFGVQIAGLAALFAALWFVGRPGVDWLVRRFPIGKDGEAPTALVAIVLALIFAAGVCTERLGVFTIFGGFLAGLLFHRHVAFVEAWRKQVGLFVLVFFLPIFFTFTGLRTNIAGLDTPSDWMWCAIFFVAAMTAKIAPVFLAGRLAGLGAGQAGMLGVMMNTRGLMELIVLNVGYSLGFLPQDVFTMLVLMAVGTTVMTGPLIAFMLRRAGAPVKEMLEA
jgi:Kef-type K+ transport system membrane component KefB